MRNWCLILFEAAAALNAACLAALDSGVVMKGTFCGVAVALSSGNLILDPDYAQCHSADAVFTFAFHLNEKVTFVLFSSSILYHCQLQGLLKRSKN